MHKYIIPLLAAALIHLPVSAKAAPQPMTQTGDRLLFDFGAKPENGWIQVSGETKYTKELGYGFSMISFIEDVPAPAESGVLSDAIKVGFRYRDRTEFKADLPDGIYEISVYTGSISYMNINLEGYPVIFNIQHDCTEARIEIPVTDGTLNMQLAPGTSGMELTASAMTITRKGDLSERRKRVFVCGDSIASTMYPLFLYQPLDESYPGGWGQMLSTYLPDSIYVHNISTPGSGTKTYIDKDTLEQRLHFAREGDYVIISLGANDKNSVTAEEYKTGLKEMTERVRALGCVPILCSDAAQLKEYSSGGYSDLCYAAQTEETSRELGEEYIDLHTAHAEYLSAVGYDEAEKLFWRQWNGSRDMTHPNRNGAGQIARILAEKLSIYDDLSGGVTDYGASDDLRLKCRINKKSVMLQNTTGSDMSYALVSPEHISHKLERVKEASVTLPAYDVLEPNKSVTVDFDSFNVGCPIYLMGDGIIIKLR